MNLNNRVQIIESFYSLNKKLDLILEHYQCKGSHLQNYLYFAYAPVFNYTKAIIILCDSRMFNAASALLRSIFEAHINIVYHQGNDSEKRLAISARERFNDLRTVFSEVSKFINDYPIHSSKDNNSLFNEQAIKEALDYIESELRNITLHNKLDNNYKKTRLLNKAQENDKVKITGAEEGHFQKMYSVIYRQLSSSVHLDILGLENFFEKDQKGSYSVKETFDDAVLIGESIGICVALTKDLYANKVINSVPEETHIIEGLLVEK